MRSATRRAPTSARCRSAGTSCCGRSRKQRRAGRSRSGLELLRPESAEAAVAALGNGSVALAGGTEVIPLLRDGLLRADTLVDVRAVVPRGVDGTRIRAGPTLAQLQGDPQIPGALPQACRP